MWVRLDLETDRVGEILDVVLPEDMGKEITLSINGGEPIVVHCEVLTSTRSQGSTTSVSLSGRAFIPIYGEDDDE